ncbi:hypothetical protein BASA60_008378 [Batrachochytrium salamandrivorans]|nr:hypothetical protein BASA60_008378 [Batrachochytrium salamandrivorans]
MSEPMVSRRELDQVQREYQLLHESHEKDRSRIATLRQSEEKWLTTESSLSILTEKHAKEIAEEYVDVLKSETATLHERIEELTLQLDISKTENELLIYGESNSTEDNALPPKTNQYQLELQNERLREALIKLRDISLNTEMTLQAKIDASKSNSDASLSLKEKNSEMEAELRHAMQDIDDLKLQLDDALGSEELVHALTDRNLQLGAKLDEMTDKIRELETLRVLNNDLDEAHMDIQKTLINEITVKDAVIADLASRVVSQRSILVDFEHTIERFRELVQKQQKEMKEISSHNSASQLPSDNDIQMNLQAHVQSAAALNLELQRAVEKVNFHRQEADMRKMDLDQAMHELGIVRLFLPEDYFKTDHDAVQCLLLLKRLGVKSQLAKAYYSDCISLPNCIEMSVYDIYIDSISVLLNIEHTTKRIYRVLESTSDENLYMRFGQLHHQLLNIEFRIDAVRTNTQSDSPSDKENYSTLCHCLDQMLEFLHSYVDKADHGVPALRQTLIRAAIEKTTHYVRRIQLETDLISYIFAMGDRNDGTLFYASLATLDSTQLPSLLHNASENVKRCSDAVSHLGQSLEKIFDNNSTPVVDLSARILSALVPLRTLSKFIISLRVKLRGMVEDAKQRRREIDYDALTSLIYSMSTDLLGTGETNPGEAFSRRTLEVVSIISGLETQLLDKDLLETCTPTVLSWSWRSKILKADFALNGKLKLRVEALDHQTHTLVHDLATKKEQLGEATAHIEVLKSKLEKHEKLPAMVHELEESLEKATEEQLLYKNAVHAMEVDLDAADAENAQLKITLRRLERQGAASPPNKRGSPSSTMGPSFPPTSNIQQNDSQLFSPPQSQKWGSVLDSDTIAKIEYQRTAIRFLMSENARLKHSVQATQMMEMLHPGDPITKLASRLSQCKVFTQPKAELVGTTQLASSMGLNLDSASKAEKLKSLAMDAQQLASEVVDFEMGSRIVDISVFTASPKHGVDRDTPGEIEDSGQSGNMSMGHHSHKWMPLNLDPSMQLHRQNVQLRGFSDRWEKLQWAVSRCQGHSSSPYISGDSHSRTVGHDHSTGVDIPFTKAQHVAVGRISMPCRPLALADRDDQDCKRVEFNTWQDFEALHTLFAL